MAAVQRPSSLDTIKPESDHPVGGAIGAATGAVAGAAAGSFAGPVGAVAGAGVGGVIGALAGKGLAQSIDEEEHEAYWKEHFATRPYVDAEEPYDTYGPAYRYGVDAFKAHEGKDFDTIEPDLSRGWKADGTLPWDRARPAAKDAYERVHTTVYSKEKEEA